MAASPPIVVNLTGQEPYASSGQPDGAGNYHVHPIKRGSTHVFQLRFPLIPDVDAYFWIAHFRSTSTSEDVIHTLRSQAGGSSDDSYIERKGASGADAQTLILYTHHDDSVALPVISGGVWDLEAFEYVSAGNPAAGFLSKDRVVVGGFNISQDITRETGSPPA